MSDRWDNHGGYGRCRGTGKVWVDDGEASNFYRSGSCPDCAPMPDRQTIADVEAQVADLTANAAQFDDIPPLRDELLRRAAALTALLASHRKMREKDWRPISELVETIQEAFILVYPASGNVPEVWANQTYFEAKRRGPIPGWTLLYESAQMITHFQAIDLVEITAHLKTPGDADAPR